MTRAYIILCVISALCATIDCRPNSSATSESTTTPGSLYVSKYATQFPANCYEVVYTCKKKLPFGTELLSPTNGDTARPCVKYCIKYTLCANGTKIKGKSNECVVLNEDMVREEYELKQKHKSNLPSEERPGVMPVALIDFPCQPGYLPDAHGRCREYF